MRSLLSTAALALCAALPLRAEVPTVVTDIAPIESLVAAVLGDLGTPGRIVPQGSSPHSHHMRPSEARSLQEADLIVWMGPELAPWMEKSVADRPSLELMDTDGTLRLNFRETVRFGAEDHHDDHDHEEHGDKEHDEHAHEKHDDHEHHDEHDEAHEEDHEEGHGHHHDHDGLDPHGWLDPENAAVWLDAVAERLAALDPEHADTYRANAAAERDKLTALSAEIKETLAGGVAPYVVFHDAYQYFERRFDLHPLGAISLGDARAPSPARIRTLQEAVTEAGAACVYSEPQFSADLVETVFGDSSATVRVIDPLGSTLPAGPELYRTLLRDLAQELAACR